MKLSRRDLSMLLAAGATGGVDHFGADGDSAFLSQSKVGDIGEFNCGDFGIFSLLQPARHFSSMDKGR